MTIEFSNPLFLLIGAVLFLVVIFLWYKRNSRNLRERRNRNFRENYYRRKKERENQKPD